MNPLTSSATKGSTLPLSYIGQLFFERKTRFELATLSFGRLMLYQLSYFRKMPALHPAVVILSGWRWIRTTVGVSQQIYSLPHLATLVSTLFEPLVGFGTNDPEITNHVLWPAELKEAFNRVRQMPLTNFECKVNAFFIPCK